MTFENLKSTIGRSNIFVHSCFCILFIVTSVFEPKIQNDLKLF